MLDRIRAEVPDYLADEGNPSFPSNDEVAEQLGAEMANYEDGYDLAQALERHGWEPSARLVEVLDGGTMDEAIDLLTAQWIEAEQVKPKLALGTVLMLGRDAAGDQEITAIDEKRGTYTVTGPGQARGSGRIHRWEDLENKAGVR
jgi:hypothetical protein